MTWRTHIKVLFVNRKFWLNCQVKYGAVPDIANPLTPTAIVKHVIAVVVFLV